MTGENGTLGTVTVRRDDTDPALRRVTFEGGGAISMVTVSLRELEEDLPNMRRDGWTIVREDMKSAELGETVGTPAEYCPPCGMCVTCNVVESRAALAEENGRLRVALAQAEGAQDVLRRELDEARAVFEEVAPHLAPKMTLAEMIRVSFAVQVAAGWQPAPFAADVDPAALTAAQRSGASCVRCGWDFTVYGGSAVTVHLINSGRAVACSTCMAPNQEESSDGQ